METLISQREVRTESIMSELMAGEMCLSYTALSNFSISPKSFIDYKLGERETTDAMIYGSMLHCLVLEPEDFHNRYFTLDDERIMLEIGGAKPRATKAYKEWYAAQTEAAGKKLIVSPDDFKHAQAVAISVRTNRASSKVLNRCPIREKAIEWEYMNFKFHGFIDGDGQDTVFDLKSMPDANPEKVQREIVNRGLHIQAAMYTVGNGSVKKYYIIAVDKMGGVSVHLLSDKLMEFGMNEYARLIGKFNECYLADAWEQSHDFHSDRFDGTFLCDAKNWMF